MKYGAVVAVSRTNMWLINEDFFDAKQIFPLFQSKTKDKKQTSNAQMDYLHLKYDAVSRKLYETWKKIVMHQSMGLKSYDEATVVMWLPSGSTRVASKNSSH